jgi:F-type H+-transporting ATPase subunit delta
MRSISRKLMMRATAPLLQNVPEGFSYLNNQVVDKDVSAAYEPLDALKLTLTRQDEFIFKEEKVRCVTLSTLNGDMGIYPCHEYKIAKLVPSVINVEMLNGSFRKFFTSGGFAHINNEGSTDVNCTECIALEDLDLGLAEKKLADAQLALAGAKDDKAKAIAEIRLSVLEAAVTALKTL